MSNVVDRRSILLCGLAAASAPLLAACDAPEQIGASADKSGSGVASGSASGAGGKVPPKRSAAPPDPELAAPPDVAAPPADATKTGSGLAYKNIVKGSGTEHPTPDNKVKVHYTGWTADGKMFDSSKRRKPAKPAEFVLSGVVAGWTEGVQLMVVGDKTRFWIPAKLGYGESPPGGMPAGQLTFDIELVEIVKLPPPPEVPKDVAKPPKEAKKTKTGLYYMSLAKGTGTTHPTADNKVQVHYSGWTTDGKMFDSSVVRGEPAQFPLKGVIPGWTEGVPLMVEGEKMRFWIPVELAYNNKPGKPAGMLVFDIELLKIL